MNSIKPILVLIVFLFGSVAVYFILSSENALVTHPKGEIARAELWIIVRNIGLMLIVAVPLILLMLLLVWKYGAFQSHDQHDPQRSARIMEELFMWLFPSIIIAIIAYHTWFDTHSLDPYRSINNESPPLTIQVVALDWKWLFIYPEQGVASINYVQFPEKTPVRFLLTADGSPMNGFWIPQLSGQIYCMTGMTTQLHVIADETGEFPGRASEINGKGFADMTFTAKSSSRLDFSEWIDKARQSPFQLTKSQYDQLVKPSQKNNVKVYSSVPDQLFERIVMKYMQPTASAGEQ